MDEHSKLLAKIYKILHKNPNGSLSNLGIYHSDVYYTRAAINAKFGTNYTLKETFDLMVEEGLIPKDKIESYGI